MRISPASPVVDNPELRTGREGRLKSRKDARHRFPKNELTTVCNGDRKDVDFC